MSVNMTLKPLFKHQGVLTVNEADEDDLSEHSEVLSTDLSLHRLRQLSYYANSESFGNISNWKSTPCFILFHCERPEPQNIH